MQRWFFTSWCGDFRLEADGDDRCVLSVVSPTPAELDKLDDFLKKARKKDWIRQHVGFVPDGESRIEVEASVLAAGRILLGEKPKGRLTAVRSVNGRVSAVEDPEAVGGSKDGAEAATVRRPTLCCPNPVPGPDRRASEVLRAFCTPRQWSDWRRDGLLRCYGGLSGRVYEIAHRHHPLAIRRGKCVWDVEAGRVMHCYDWSVPAAEEVLALKLVLEHREDWIRNPSGAYARGDDEMVFPHPLVSKAMQARDGLQDAAIVRAAPYAALGAAVGLGVAS